MELNKKDKLFIYLLLVITTISFAFNILFLSLNFIKNNELSINGFNYRYDVVSLNDNNYAIIDNVDETIIIKGIDSNSYNNNEIKVR